MKKIVKHPKEMTADEAIAHVFHPKALRHVKKHVERLSAKKGRLKKDSD
ncbi:MAG: hypothetical protein ABSG44_21110 [Thermodesulfobacteriota bacterium]|jgi:hypothetical protein